MTVRSFSAFIFLVPDEPDKGEMGYVRGGWTWFRIVSNDRLGIKGFGRVGSTTRMVVG
jgi:hypothetical protein